MINQQKNSVASYVVEGNIGAGKSTFLTLLSKALDVQVVYEPHAKWQDVQGAGNILDYFYKDTKRWAYTFQSYAFISRVMEQELSAKKATHPIQIIERSVFSDRYCFANNCYHMGTMNALEWKLYQEWFSWLVKDFDMKPAGFIYLQTDPDVCYERLVKRSRSEEASVSREYLHMLHQKHENWLVHKQEVYEGLAKVPVLILKCNLDFEQNSDQMAGHVAKIRAFIGESRTESITGHYARVV